jgi:predicted GIY-YIG superfamily endonuclease
MSKEWYCYLLTTPDKKYSYIGITINLNRRLRQHNGELVGGAKATRKSKEWYRVCYVKGFPSHVDALQFEWKWKRLSRYKRKIEDKIICLLELLSLEKSTVNSRPFASYPQPLTIIYEII